MIILLKWRLRISIGVIFDLVIGRGATQILSHKNLLSINLKTLGDISDLENVPHKISYIFAVLARYWQISCVIRVYKIVYN